MWPTTHFGVDVARFSNDRTVKAKPITPDIKPGAIIEARDGVEYVVQARPGWPRSRIDTLKRLRPKIKGKAAVKARKRERRRESIDHR